MLFVNADTSGEWRNWVIVQVRLFFIDGFLEEERGEDGVKNGI